jgi:hypothetical protein
VRALITQLRGKPYNKGRLLKTSVSLTAGIVLLVAATWFGLPLLRRMRGDD